MPGPAKRSNSHKLGTGSKKVHVGEDLTPPLLRSVPPPPRTLKEYGIEMWNSHLSRMIEEEMLTEWDLPELEAMCREWQTYCKACDNIDEKGTTFVMQTGYEQIRPIVGEKNKSLLNFNKLSNQHGGNNVSRAKMKRVRPVEEKENPFDNI